MPPVARTKAWAKPVFAGHAEYSVSKLICSRVRNFHKRSCPFTDSAEALFPPTNLAGKGLLNVGPGRSRSKHEPMALYKNILLRSGSVRPHYKHYIHQKQSEQALCEESLFA